MPSIVPLRTWKGISHAPPAGRGRPDPRLFAEKSAGETRVWRGLGPGRRSAIAALDDLVFDLVVLDINLPKVSGMQVLRSTRKNKSTVAILVLTAADTSLQKVEGLDG